MRYYGTLTCWAGAAAPFDQWMRLLRVQHARKPGLLERLDRARPG